MPVIEGTPINILSLISSDLSWEIQVGTRLCTLAAARFSCQVQTTRQRADEFSIRSSILFSVRTSRKRKGFYNFELTAQNTCHLSLSNVQKQRRRKWCFKLPLFYLPPSIPYFHFLWSMTGTWAVVSVRACTGSAFLLNNGTSHSFHKFMLVCVCWSSPEKNKVSRSSRCLAFTSCFTLTSEINFKVNL